MSRYSTTVSSNHPPADVFDYLADLRNLQEWDPGVSSSTLVEGAEPSIGAVYRVIASGMELRYQTERYDRGVSDQTPRSPSVTVLRAENWLLASTDTITVEATESGSSATYEAELSLRAPLSLFDPILQQLFNRIGDRAANGLARKLGSDTLRTKDVEQ